MGSETFNRALSNMTGEIAYKAAVRHLVDIGYSMKEIEKQLTYPAPYEKIRECAYEYMCESGMILLKEPLETQSIKRYDYVLEEGKYGQKTYKRVLLDQTQTDMEEYIPVDFGLMSTEEMQNLKKELSAGEWEYISEIPWPKARVYLRKTNSLVYDIIKSTTHEK